MLYIKDRLLFIHVPRSAGNAIARTLVSEAVKQHDVLYVGDSTPRDLLHRHATYNEIIRVIPEVASGRVVPVAVHRDPDAIFQSDYRLHQSSCGSETGSEWERSIEQSHYETLIEFITRRWQPWIGDKTPWEHWVGDANVWRIEYDEIEVNWPHLCEVAGIGLVDLPKLDWQKDYSTSQ